MSGDLTRSAYLVGPVQGNTFLDTCGVLGRCFSVPERSRLAPGGWAFELKWDGFRAIVSTENGLDVRSRRNWRMADRVPELEQLPRGLVLDGELVAFNESGAPDWPVLCGRMLHGNPSVAATFVAFDVLRIDGHDLTRSRWEQRRAVLEELWEPVACARLSDVFDDGHVLFDAVCEHGLEGIVAKRRNGLYRPAHRGWVKVKNPGYWRREAELASVTRSIERRGSGRRRETVPGGGVRPTFAQR